MTHIPRRAGALPRFCLCLFVAGLWMVSSDSYGQTAPAIPTIVDPRPPLAAPKIEAETPDVPKVAIESAGSTAPPGADAVNVTYQAIAIDGATAFSEAERAVWVAPLLGKTASLKELFVLAETIQSHYLDQGYFLARVVVPAQESAEGRFTIRVIEGYVGQLTFEEGVPPVIKGQLRHLFAPALQERPLRLSTLERVLLLANDFPGYEVVATLRPGTQATGEAALLIAAKLKRLEGSFSVNNRGSRFAGPWRGALIAQANTVFVPGDQVQGVGFSAVDYEEQRFGQMAYRMPLGRDGLTLTATGSYGEGDPGYTLSPLEVKTSSLTGALALEYPLWRGRASSLWVNGGLTVTESNVRLLGGALSHDQLRVAAVGVRYVDPRWLAGDFSGQFSLRQGTDFLWGSKKGDAGLSRSQGDPAASVLYGEVAERWRLFDPVALAAVGAGQYAFASVLSDEEFRLGGDRFGRGYNPSELSGDHGAAGSLELQYDGRSGYSVFSAYQAYLFADYGVVWNDDGGGSAGPQALASVGLGVRTEALDGLYLTLELARPIARDLSTGERAQGPGRLLFTLTSVF